MKNILGAISVLLLLTSCEQIGETAEKLKSDSSSEEADEKTAPSLVEVSKNPFPSTYVPYPSKPVLLTGATVLTGDGARIENGAVLMRGGKIAAVGAAGEISAPEGADTIDVGGKWVTPGIVDVHSHMGVYPAVGASGALSDGNEATSPNTAGVWAEHSVWPQDPAFSRALAGGTTTFQVLPGSANLFGGRSVVLKNVASRTVQDMKFPGAPYGLKMACGENPKGVYGEQGGPSTLMGSVKGYREAWISAREYAKSWDDYREEYEKWEKGGKSDNPPSAPSRDLKMETLAGVLDGDILIHFHCYRADEMVQALGVAKEFDYKITAFHHAIEGYKIADILAENDVCAAVWADWWGFKVEAFDTVFENAALIDAQPNGCAIIHSDSSEGVQRLNQEAAKAMFVGRRRGLNIPPEHAIKWITENAAKALGIEKMTGTLEAEKMADVVVWNQNPFSYYAKAEKVYIDGALMFDRDNPGLSPRPDFEIGLKDNGFNGGAGQ